MPESSERDVSPSAEALTALDAAFLYLERPGLPAHIASVGTFEAGPLLDADGQLVLDQLRAQVSSRLDALPRLRRRVAWAPWSLGGPSWVDDESFDIANHVDSVELSDSDGGLLRYAEALVAEPLPRDRPLWHLRFVTGLGDRVALVERVHHALVDGVSGVDVATVLLDLTEEVEEPRPSTWAPTPAPDPVRLGLQALRSQVSAPLRVVRSGLASLAHPTALARQGQDIVTALGTVLRDGLLAPRSPLNIPIGCERRLAWLSADLEAVKRTGRVHGATANDVALAAIAHGLRELLLHRGATVAGDQVVKVLVPVSLRDEGQRGTLGNRVGALLLRLPIGLVDPTERLRVISATSRDLKQRREATTAAVLLAAADVLPRVAVEQLARSTDSQRLVNLIVTNVPGPACPLYCRGARMLEAFPVVPLGGNLSISIALLSYDGTLSIGITADGGTVPDIEVLRAGIEAGLAELEAGGAPAAHRARTG